MIPVGDFQRRSSTPYVNWALIGLNVAIFLYTVTLSSTPDGFIGGLAVSPIDRFYFDWSFMPPCLAEFAGVHTDANPADMALICPTDGREPFQIVTAMFLHAGWAHILSNMLFLWIFGDNVEDRLGHFHYLGFYLLCGIIAAIVQIAFSIDTLIPNVGASGAIAGVVGAYLLFYPKAIVQVIILPLFFIPFYVPAVFLIVIWFLTQLMSGIAELGETVAGSGTAWWAHIGGFIAGVILILPLMGRAKRRRLVT